LADIYTDIATIAGILNASERGFELITAMQQAIDDVRHRVAQSATTRPIVFCEEWGKPIIASQPWVAELVEAAGGEFAVAPGSTMEPDAIAATQPDVIVAAWCGAGDRVPLEKIVEQRGWSQLTAVAHGRVFCINDELLNTPASCLIGGLRAIAWSLHPQLFPQPGGIRQIRPV
jgi:iron complex transport system substrate-binding protein